MRGKKSHHFHNPPIYALLIRTSKFSILNIEVGSLTDVFQHHLDHVVLVPFPHLEVVEECAKE